MGAAAKKGSEGPGEALGLDKRLEQPDQQLHVSETHRRKTRRDVGGQAGRRKGRRTKEESLGCIASPG